jgi:hypothetical protein
MNFVYKVLAACALVAVTIYLVRAVDSLNMMPLSIEHQVELESEFRAGDELNWREYRENEEKIEEELVRKMSGHEFRHLNRHAPDSMNKANSRSRNYNHSFSLKPRSSQGSAVLIHGLTDSP